MSTLLFLAGTENPIPGLAVAGLNLIVGLALISISLLLCAMVCLLACLEPIASGEMRSIRGLVGRRLA
jgi:hypothetical protein